MRMAKAQLSAGMTFDGFRLDERIHRGGMATIWRVSRADIDIPIVMKVPFLDFEGDLSLLVGFEVEQMIMAELKAAACAAVVRQRRFRRAALHRDGVCAGPTLLRRMLGRNALRSMR